MKPQRIAIANLPTRIDELTCFSNDFNPRLFIKRDDQTGTEWSGNKIRKLEYALAEALQEGADTLITCGGIQSNHCRATAALAAHMGLKSVLLLRSDTRAHPEGNHLLSLLFGADIRWVNSLQYASERHEIMQAICSDLEAQGRKAYIIPEGASNAIGTFGYYHAYEEILSQEEELGISFDTIVCAVGSGGTYAGLVFANAAHNDAKKIVGINIAADAEYFRDVVMKLHEDFCLRLGSTLPLSRDSLFILDGFAGRGYARNTPEEMDFLRDFSQKSGILLDPVYTGKAMRGLVDTLTGTSLLADAKNILFVHTGGVFGLFPKAGEFDL